MASTLTTKRKPLAHQARVQTVPEIYGCLICEIVRTEQNGTFTLLGFYGLAPHVSIGVNDFSKPVGFVCLLQASAAFQESNVAIRMVSPSGIEIQPLNSRMLLAGPLQSVFAAEFRGVLSGPGLYTLELLIDGEVRRQTTIDIAAAHHGNVSEPASKPNPITARVN
jgi:hypothetical protein